MGDQISFKDLLGTGAHFGHVTRKWHPNYEPYILMESNGVHIINLEETAKNLTIAIDFIRKVVEKNGEILFVGTKKQAKDIVQQEADRCGMFYVVERWLGGTLTNFTTIKKSIKRLKALEKEGSSIYENLTKKEIQMLNRERLKLSDQHRGIKDMRRLPDVVVIVDVEREFTALQEAIRLEIPVVALIDTNCDPRLVNYPIPANDDSIRTIQLIISAIVDAILEAKGELISEENDVTIDNVTDSEKKEKDNKAKKVKVEELIEEPKDEKAKSEPQQKDKTESVKGKSKAKSTSKKDTTKKPQVEPKNTKKPTAKKATTTKITKNKSTAKDTSKKTKKD
jgi:small subunit ribosomal protein S2